MRIWFYHCWFFGRVWISCSRLFNRSNSAPGVRFWYWWFCWRKLDCGWFFHRVWIGICRIKNGLLIGWLQRLILYCICCFKIIFSLYGLLYHTAIGSVIIIVLQNGLHRVFCLPCSISSYQLHNLQCSYRISSFIFGASFFSNYLIFILHIYLTVFAPSCFYHYLLIKQLQFAEFFFYIGCITKNNKLVADLRYHFKILLRCNIYLVNHRHAERIFLQHNADVSYGS